MLMWSCLFRDINNNNDILRVLLDATLLFFYHYSEFPVIGFLVFAIGLELLKASFVKEKEFHSFFLEALRFFNLLMAHGEFCSSGKLKSWLGMV